MRRLHDSFYFVDEADRVETLNSINKAKTYRALLNQGGTSAPVATVLENTLGVTPVFSYLGSGLYAVTATGVLPAAKTFKAIGNDDSGKAITFELDGQDVSQPDAIAFAVESGNSQMTNVSFEIVVYT